MRSTTPSASSGLPVGSAPSGRCSTVGGGSERPDDERRRGRSGRPTAPSDLCSAQLLGGRRGDRDRGRLLASADPLRAPPALLPWGVDVSHDRGCRRCHRPHSAFRVQRGFDWLPVCRDCLEPGDVVYVDLPNGELVGDVAEEVST